MDLSKIKAPELVNQQVTGVIEKGAEFDGTLAYHGCFHINGTVRGKIITPDMLVVGEHGKVEGEIEAGVVVVYGHVEAIINAKHRVDFKRPAVFKGEMITPSLEVEDGVLFEGTNKML